MIDLKAQFDEINAEFGFESIELLEEAVFIDAEARLGVLLPVPLRQLYKYFSFHPLFQDYGSLFAFSIMPLAELNWDVYDNQDVLGDPDYADMQRLTEPHFMFLAHGENGYCHHITLSKAEIVATDPSCLHWGEDYFDGEEQLTQLIENLLHHNIEQYRLCTEES